MEGAGIKKEEMLVNSMGNGKYKKVQTWRTECF